MRKLPVLLMLITINLVGCAAEPQIIYQPYKVEVPIPVSCVKDKPERPTLDAAKHANDRVLYLQNALAERKELKAYALQLETMIKACEQ